MKKQTIVLALLLLIAVFGLPAAAYYDFDGFPLTTSSSGTVYGGVYTGVGDNDGGATTPPDYTTNYTLPDDAVSVWARLYVDAWGGTEDHTGWINVSFNSVSHSVFYNGTNDINSNCYGSGHGVVWVWFDVTNNVTGGTNRVDVASTLFEGDITRAVLVCAYNGTDGCGHLVNYWVNDGNVNLHYDGSSGYYYNNDVTTTWFNGAVDRTKMCDAKLTTVYHASCGGDGTASEPDYLYFNVIPTTTNHAPYYHLPNQLGDDGNNQYGVEWGDDDYADGYGFTLKATDVTCLLNATDNSATFWRGHNATNGPIYHNASWGEPAGAEGEAYVHPCIAVLTVNTTTVYAEMGMIGGVDNYFGIPLMDSKNVDTTLSSLSFPNPGYVIRYNSTAQAFETCILWNGAHVGGEFSMLDPVRGYIAKPNTGTLTWTSK